MIRLLLALVVVSGCATPNDVRYTASYGNITPGLMNSLVLEATYSAGYEVANRDQKHHFLVFVTSPIHLDPSDKVDVAFQVQVVYELQTKGKTQFTIIVAPRAFVDEKDVGEARLPPNARSRAAQLVSAIREHARQYEAPL